MFNSVSRRYTPPTCTLEIAARNSALSRWSDRSLVKQVQFQLSFDDPTLPPDRQVRLQGDGVQLEALCESVSAYVQNFLAQPTLPLTGVNGHSPTATAERAALTVLQPVDAVPPRAIDSGIQLKPVSLVSHELHLGSLATPDSGETIRLSTVQLVDLADALEAYSQDVATLPSLERSRWPSSRRSWLAIAAGTIVAIGLGTTLLQFVSDLSAPIATTAPADDSEIAQAPAPVPTAPNAPPTVAVSPGSEFASPRPLQLPPAPPPGAIQSPLPAPRQAPAPPRQVPTRPLQTPRPAPSLPSVAIAPPAARPQPSAPTQSIQIQPAPEAATQPDNAPSIARVAPPSAADASPSATAASPTAFDTIPQVAEARDYFQQRWQPPEGLTQTLEYRLQVGADGRVESITPLGQAAGNFVDRTPISLVGEALVSPLAERENAQLRLVLSPDGRVRTFLEGAN